MKLSDFSPEHLAVQGVKVPIDVEADDLLPATVTLELDVTYTPATGHPEQKTISRVVDCERVDRVPAKAKYAYRLTWMVNLHKEDELRDQLVKVTFRLPRTAVKAMAPATIAVVGIDITRQDRLRRIMLHEFSTPLGDFDPHVPQLYLNGLTSEQRRVLVGSAAAKPAGRLVIFITLCPRSHRRMYADWSDRLGVGVVPNATFSVFFCRDDVNLKVPAASTSPITLVCHTEYFCLCTKNPRTQTWLNPPRKTPKAPGIYGDQRPNVWLKKSNSTPPKFVMAALQPSAEMSKQVIWNAIYEASSGHNIMPGNSVHGIINTKGCWMLFRNFNWPREVADELDRIYRKVYRPVDEKPTAAVLAALKGKDARYVVEKRSDKASSSLEKFSIYDRNWAYEWFFHDVVGIKYFSDFDYWGNRDSVNDFNVGGYTFLDAFPLDKTRQPQDRNLAYHNFGRRDKDVKIGPGLFGDNALGIKTASDFSKDMHRQLTPAELESCGWADVYFYKDDALRDAESLSAADVQEP